MMVLFQLLASVAVVAFSLLVAAGNEDVLRIQQELLHGDLYWLARDLHLIGLASLGLALVGIALLVLVGDAPGPAATTIAVLYVLPTVGAVLIAVLIGVVAVSAIVLVFVVAGAFLKTS